MSRDALTEAEAEMMLALLSRHYGQPVMPVRRYCHAIETWMGVMEDNERAKPEREQVAAFLHLRTVRIAIHKSNLLYRMIYRGEKLRPTKCPVHQGVQSTQLLCLGSEHHIVNGVIRERGNECGCDGTGWLAGVTP